MGEGIGVRAWERVGERGPIQGFAQELTEEN
jgi:hypothetical protein